MIYHPKGIPFLFISNNTAQNPAVKNGIRGYSFSAQEYYRDMDLEKALDKLQESEKALIILRYYEDKQLGEIAEIFQENLNTIKSRLYRTLKKLREELSALENKEGPDSVPGYLRIQEEAGGGSKGKALGGRLRYWDGREECENE